MIAVDGGEARRVTNLPTGADAPKWFPDSQRLAFVSAIWTDLVRWEDQEKRRKERDETKMSGKIWTRAPIAYWDHYLDDREPHLFSIAADGSGEPLAITRQSGFFLSKNEYSAASYDISPDGLEVAFAANTDRSGTLPNFDVIVLEACGCKAPRNITADNPGDDDAPLYSPDGRWLAFTQQKIPTFYADRARLMLLDRAPGGATRSLSGDWDRSAGSLSWRPDSKALFGAIDDAGTNRVWRFELASAGRPRAITAGSSFSGVAVARSGGAKPAAVAIRQSFSEPPTLVRLDLGSGTAAALSTFNDAPLAAIRQGKVESVTYRGARNADIQMWVVYPPDFDPAKKYPVFMLLHGGPHNGDPGRGAVALECAGVRELGLRGHLAQLPRLERLRPGLHRLDQPGPHHAALRGHDQGGGLAALRSPGWIASGWWRAAAAMAASSPRRCSDGRTRSRR